MKAVYPDFEIILMDVDSLEGTQKAETLRHHAISSGSSTG